MNHWEAESSISRLKSDMYLKVDRYELDTLRSTVARLERTIEEFQSETYGLRDRVQSLEAHLLAFAEPLT